MIRSFYLLAGLVSMTVGMIGILLPLLPTVPFLILAAFFFARSDARLENWLLEHPIYGSHIRLWREHGAISRKGKLAAMAGFAFSVILSLILMPWPWWLATVAAALIFGTWIWKRPEG